MKMLVVDDDLATRTVLKRFLDRFGDCHAAINGHEALEFFEMSHNEGQPYTLVLMDIMMPVLDGQECLKRLRAMEQERKVAPGKETKVVMTTCLCDSKNVTQSFFQGLASGYLVKPITLDTLTKELIKLDLLTQEQADSIRKGVKPGEETVSPDCSADSCKDV